MSEDLAPSASSDSEHSSSSSSNADSETPVELLVTGRAKRSTAGTRIGSLIQKEKDELVDLVFEKEEGDVDSEEDFDFVGDGDEAGSDAQLDSSSDDEDEAKVDDLEGEKELQKQVRQERQKKRKAQGIFKTPAITKKKVKVDLTAASASNLPTTPAPRPKKNQSGFLGYPPRMVDLYVNPLESKRFETKRQYTKGWPRRRSNGSNR